LFAVRFNTCLGKRCLRLHVVPTPITDKFFIFVALYPNLTPSPLNLLRIGFSFSSASGQSRTPIACRRPEILLSCSEIFASPALPLLCPMSALFSPPLVFLLFLCPAVFWSSISSSPWCSNVIVVILLSSEIYSFRKNQETFHLG
jgi:hypothetical protein